MRRNSPYTSGESRLSAAWSPSFQALNKSVTSVLRATAISIPKKDYHAMAGFSWLLPPAPAEGAGQHENHGSDQRGGRHRRQRLGHPTRPRGGSSSDRLYRPGARGRQSPPRRNVGCEYVLEHRRETALA